jgi:hypothetical protein
MLMLGMQIWFFKPSPGRRWRLLCTWPRHLNSFNSQRCSTPKADVTHRQNLKRSNKKETRSIDSVVQSRSRKANICQIIQQISHILRTRMFITLVTTSRHCSLSLPKLVKCTSSDWSSERSVLLLSFRIPMFLPSDPVPSSSSTKPCVHFP